jgi:hypothetical protein
MSSSLQDLHVASAKARDASELALNNALKTMGEDSSVHAHAKTAFVHASNLVEIVHRLRMKNYYPGSVPADVNTPTVAEPVDVAEPQPAPQPAPQSTTPSEQLELAVRARDSAETALGFAMTTKGMNPAMIPLTRRAYENSADLVLMLQERITPVGAGADEDLMEFLPMTADGFPFVMTPQDPEYQAYLASCRRQHHDVHRFTMAGKLFFYSDRPGSTTDLQITLLTLDELYARPTLGAEHAYKIARALVLFDKDFAKKEMLRILHDAVVIPETSPTPRPTATQRGLQP